MPVTCFVKYKESTKRVLVEGNGTVNDLKAALLGTPFKELVTENLLVQVSYNLYVAYFYEVHIIMRPLTHAGIDAALKS